MVGNLKILGYDEFMKKLNAVSQTLRQTYSALCSVMSVRVSADQYECFAEYFWSFYFSFKLGRTWILSINNS